MKTILELFEWFIFVLASAWTVWNIGLFLKIRKRRLSSDRRAFIKYDGQDWLAGSYWQKGALLNALVSGIIALLLGGHLLLL